MQWWGESLKPTKTTNRLHFEDLSHERFEDLCINIVNRIRRWKSINSHTRTGGDDGIDIKAIEETSNKVWCVQCKRCQKITSKDLTNIIDKIIDKIEIVPDVILTIIACNVSKQATDDYEKHAKAKGVSDVRLITASSLEAMLYDNHSDLLSVYFDTRDESEEIIKKRIEMRQKFKTVFIEKYTGNPNDLIDDPSLQFKYRNVIIRDVNDKLFPGADEKTNIPGWFRYGLYDAYQEHFEVMIGIDYILIDKNNNWDLILDDNYKEEDLKKDDYNKVKVYSIAQISYENIVAIDTEVDDYYGLRTIFCNFNFPNEYVNKVPFKKIEYDLICKDQRNIRFRDEDRKILK